MPGINQVRGTFGAEGAGQPAYNPWRNIASPLIYLDAEFQNPASATVMDYSGNSRNFTLQGGASMNKVDSRGNRYFDLNTSSLIPTSGADYITTNFPQVTYALWTRVKPNSTSTGSGDWRTLTRTITGGGHHVIVDIDGSAGARIGHWDGTFQNSNYQIATLGASTDGMQTAGGTGHGQWTFLVFKYQASNPQWQMFVNGNQTTAAAVMPVSSNFASTSPLYSQGAAGWPGIISGCCGATGGGNQFWGDIAVWAAWGSFISAADLTRLYNETKHNFQLSPGWATARLKNFSSGQAYSEQLQVNYEYPVTNFAVVAGSLPSGLSLNASTGVISGTPSGSNQTPTIRATFSNGVTSDQVVTINSAELYTFTSATFGTGGASNPNGPNITQARSALGNPAWASTYLNMTTNGIQEWTVPATGNYGIDCYGAQGGNAGSRSGGLGARAYGVHALTQGQVLKIVVGQQGSSGPHTQDGQPVAAGGGMSAVATSTNTPLVVAGGGGGAAQNSWTNTNGLNAVTSQEGGNNSNGNGRGTGGNGATGTTEGGMAAGFFGNGGVPSGTPAGDVAKSFTNGAVGGRNARSWGGSEIYGGFGGGGGGGGLAAGGGGGYSGGAAGVWSSPQEGGGGGSYVTGSSTILTAGARSGNGQVIITRL